MCMVCFTFSTFLTNVLLFTAVNNNVQRQLFLPFERFHANLFGKIGHFINTAHNSNTFKLEILNSHCKRVVDLEYAKACDVSNDLYA